MMKNKAIVFLLVIVSILVFVGCSVNPATEPAEKIVIDVGENLTTAHRLTVNATGSIKIMPDVAYATVGVTTQNADMKKAQSDNKELMNKLFDALKNMGLTEDDMRTTNYSAYPIYDYKDSGKEITNYEVTNMVQLTIKEIDNVGQYIDIAADNGANTAYPISFSLLDKNAYYNDALADALHQAKSKADTIASTGEYTIVGTLEISEGSYGYDPYREYMVKDEAEMYSGGATPITAGELEVTANITVVYEIQ